MNGWMLHRCVVPLAALCLWTAAAAAQDRDAIAHERFSHGAQLYGSHQYEQALDEFRASNQLLPSPNSRLFIARCMRELNRIDEAVGEYRIAVAEATERARLDPRYGPTRDAAVSELASIEPRVGSVVLRGQDIPAGTVIHVGRRVVPVEALNVSIPMMPGNFAVTVDAPGHESYSTSIHIEASRSSSAELHVGVPTRAAVEPTPASTGASTVAAGSSHEETRTHAESGQSATSSPAFALGWVAVALGAVGMGSFGVFDVLASQQYNMVVMDCHGQSICPSSEGPAISTGQTYQLLTNVSLVAGIALLGVGALMEIIVLARGGSHSQEHARVEPGWAALRF